MRRITALVAVTALAVTLAACSSNSNDTASPSVSSQPAGSPGALPAVTGGFGQAPTVAKPAGDPPTELVSKDLVVGTGATATPTSTVSVNYHGVKWSDGTVFDSSFARGQAVDFPLQQLIPCWQQGIPGMKVGGRRLLVCPPAIAYGPAGPSNPLYDQTLVFVVDLVNVS